MAKRKSKSEIQTDNLYTLEVFIISGPISEEFVKENPKISRKIEILGSQTLKDLHNIIFEAYDHEEEHMYEFQIGGKGPNDPNAKKYVLPLANGFLSEKSKPHGAVNNTTMSSLKIKIGATFGYWFDFGDDWWHQINVISIENEIPKDNYPKIINRVGDSPPQYMDMD